jgi:Hypoxia induced protein conserved region
MALDAVGIMMAMATVVVFIWGLFSMVRGGEYDRNHSGGLMLARVEFQALAIALLAVAAFLAQL